MSPRRLAASLCVLVLMGGCRRGADEQEEHAAAPRPSPSAAPDRVADDELPEGEVTAFGLRLPRGFVVAAAYPDETKARGSMPLRKARRYLEERLRDGTLTADDHELLFDKVRVRQEPVRDLAVRVYVHRDTGETCIDVRDLTRPPPPNLPNDEARYRAAGFRKDGQLLDPQHTE